jgi:hypothetical protein
MKIQTLAKLVTAKLAAFKPAVTASSTGSIYISFESAKIKQIRVSNHNGHKAKSGTWQLRTDASTKRNGSKRIYGHKSILRMCEDFKKIIREEEVEKAKIRRLNPII